MSEILKDKIERAKQEIELHVGTCGAPNCRRKGLFSYGIIPMPMVFYYPPNPFRLNGTAENTISWISEHYEAYAHSRSRDSLEFIYEYIFTTPKRFSDAVDPLLRINDVHDNHTRKLSKKIKESVDTTKVTCEAYADINQRYQEGDGVGTFQLAELKSRLLYLQSAMLNLRSCATSTSISSLINQKIPGNRHTVRLRESLIGNATNKFKEHQLIVDNLRCDATSIDCRVKTLGSIQSCFRLVDDAAALYYRLTKAQEETVAHRRCEFEPTLDDLLAVMQKTKLVLSRISPAIAAQVNITPTGTARARLNILLARLSDTLNGTRLGLNQYCPTFVSSPIQSPYNNHYSIDGYLEQFRESWMRLFIIFLDDNDGVDALVKGRIYRQEQWSRHLTDRLRELVSTYSTSMQETGDLIEQIHRDLDRLNSRAEELYNQGDRRPDSRGNQTHPVAKKNPPSVPLQSVSAIQPVPAPQVIQPPPPSSPAVAEPFRPTTGSFPPRPGKVRKRQKNPAETVTQKPRGGNSYDTRIVIKEQPHLPFLKTKVYWGFFDQDSNYGPKPNDLFNTIIKSYAPGIEKTALDDRVRRKTEKSTGIMPDGCFADRFKNRNLRHFTIPHMNIAIFYNCQHDNIYVYIVASHFGRGNDRYRGEGSVPESPGRTFSTTVTLK